MIILNVHGNCNRNDQRLIPINEIKEIMTLLTRTVTEIPIAKL